MRPHLLRGRGKGNEIADLRQDVEEAFSSLEAAGVPARSFFVKKGGHDSNSGTSPGGPYLTISQALTAAVALVPAVDARCVVNVLDAGVYVEDVVVPAHVTLWGPHAALHGAGVAAQAALIGTGCIVELFEFAAADGTPGLIAENTAGIKRVRFRRALASGAGSFVAVNVGVSGGVLYYTAEETRVGTGATGIGDISTLTGHIHIEQCGDIYLEGAGATGIARLGSGSTVGSVTHILEVDAGVGAGIGLQVSGGEMNLTVGELATNADWAVVGGATLNLFALQHAGTGGGAGTINVTIP